MNSLIASLQHLPQWVHIAIGLLFAAFMAVLVMTEDL